MHRKYHRVITQASLQGTFGNKALQAIISANLARDDLASLIFHPEQHFVDNRMGASRAYIDSQRRMVVSGLQNEADIHLAWQAFGRLLHTAQDFYAHSNYVRLWAERYHGALPPVEQIDALDSMLLTSPELRTVRPYRPLGSLANLPKIGRLFFPQLPEDAHARMSLDSEASGPLFEYAFQAAIQRTQHEYQLTVQAIAAHDAIYRISEFLDR